MFLMSLGMRRDRMIALLLTSLTIFLAMLGIRSGGLHDPAIVVGNLLGGFAMLGLLGWMVFRKTDDRARRAWRVGPWPWAVLVVLCAQIALGALTSANFAASACRTLPDCHGSWLPGSDVTAAFDLTRQHRVGETGMVIGGPERADIQKLHRIMALLVTAVALIAGTRAMRARGDVVTAGILLVVLVGMELLAGIAAIATELPIALALAHNSLAALSLLAAVKLLADSRRSSGGSLLVSTS
jgi:cytochrome c oxidase assembly protein subunit 15